jgi:hypothetical protein
MNNLFFWIIILSLLIPVAMRMYRRSVQKRDQSQNFPGQYPGGFPGSFSGRPKNQPSDGYTQQDYMSGGFGLPRNRGRDELPPLDQPYPNPPYQQFPQPGQQPQPGQYPQPGSVPYEDSPEYRANPPQPQAHPTQHETGPVTAPPPSAPQGYRARKLAELDQQYSNGEISMEEYMTRRNEIMNG